MGSGAFQGEGFVYMAYVSTAMQRASSTPAERTRRSRRTPPSPRPPTGSSCTTSRARQPDLTALHEARSPRSRTGRRSATGSGTARLAAQRGAARPGRRRAADADRLDLAVPDAAARTRRVAADAARSRRRRRRGWRTCGRSCSRASTSSCRAAPVAAEPAVGRRVQRDQVVRRSDQHDADGGADQHRDVLDRERRPPVQRRRAQHRHREEPQPAETRGCSRW